MAIGEVGDKTGGDRPREHCICTFFVTFFSVTIDGRNLIFGHKLHIFQMNKCRIYVGDQLDRWNELKEVLRVQTLAEVAKILLDR